MSETKRRKNPAGSHASLGGRSLRDEIEMHNRSRPTSGLYQSLNLKVGR